VRSGVEVDIRPFQTRENNPPSRRDQGSMRVRTRLRGEGRAGQAKTLLIFSMHYRFSLPLP
jgi:hypothetical protein